MIDRNTDRLELSKIDFLICGTQDNPQNVIGDAGRRSPCLSHAKRALYHLSYIPSIHHGPVIIRAGYHPDRDYKPNSRSLRSI